VVNWFADKWAERFEFEAETWRRKASQTRALAATGVNLKTTWSGHSTTSFKTMFMKSTSVLSPLTLNRTNHQLDLDWNLKIVKFSLLNIYVSKYAIQMCDKVI
jgi:hypothetical protein